MTESEKDYHAQHWAKLLFDVVRRQVPHVQAVLVDAPYVFLIEGDHATRCWVPETLGPVPADPGSIFLRAVPANAPALAKL